MPNDGGTEDRGSRIEHRGSPVSILDLRSSILGLLVGGRWSVVGGRAGDIIEQRQQQVDVILEEGVRPDRQGARPDAHRQCRRAPMAYLRAEGDVGQALVE